ncbi:unnamed protein product, partial [Prorocentrum cordatum]
RAPRRAMLSRAGAALPAGAASRRRARGLAAVQLRRGPPLGRRWAAAAGAPRVLEGLRVLELASVLAGPTVGQFLGELGADVVKVENLSRRATGRSWKLTQEPPEAAGGVTAYFSREALGSRGRAAPGGPRAAARPGQSVGRGAGELQAGGRAEARARRREPEAHGKGVCGHLLLLLLFLLLLLLVFLLLVLFHVVVVLLLVVVVVFLL